MDEDGNFTFTKPEPEEKPKEGVRKEMLKMTLMQELI